MSTELAEVQVSQGTKLEQAQQEAGALNSEQQLSRDLYGSPEGQEHKKEGSSESVSKKDGGPITLDDNGNVATFGNESGMIENFQERLKEMLAADEGKHVLKVGDKEFSYTRNADGIRLHTPDFKDGIVINNDGEVVKMFDNQKDGKPKMKVWE